MNKIREDLGGVRLGKGVPHVVDIVVNLVSLDAVIFFQTLHDIIFHLHSHLLFRWVCEVGDGQDKGEDATKDGKLS